MGWPEDRIGTAEGASTEAEASVMVPRSMIQRDAGGGVSFHNSTTLVMSEEAILLTCDGSQPTQHLAKPLFVRMLWKTVKMMKMYRR